MLQGDSVAQFNSVIDLSKLIQQARFQVRGYTYSGKPEAEQPALDAIGNALKKTSKACRLNCRNNTSPTCNRQPTHSKPIARPSASSATPRLPVLPPSSV